MKIEKFFTSGWDFSDKERDLKSRYQMVNIGILISSIGLIFGITGNIIRDISGFVPFELFLLTVNLIIFFVLRKSRESFKYIPPLITFLFTVLFLFLIYMSEPDSMKHIWLFTYPIILLYFQKKQAGAIWLTIIILLLLILPVQPFVEVHYSMYQVVYLCFVLVVVSTIIYFYQVKMAEAKKLILEQQMQLHNFNVELEKQVKEKTIELTELNEHLEIKVQEKIDELIDKDKIMSIQSKQAVMGEMITMIAHQWRQPLSTITLQISNYQFKQLLSKNVKEREIDKTLAEISDTIIYLSDTVDDFQTYFNPDKKLTKIEVHELIQKAINFALPRLKESEVAIELDRAADIQIVTYINEIVQVILNIINNAIDVLLISTTQTPKISINVKEISGSAFISIKDNADGIKDENLPRIFEPYFSTKGKNGTGLGLYMSQMIMQKQFETEIEVQTSKNGSVFTIEVPKNIS